MVILVNNENPLNFYVQDEDSNQFCGYGFQSHRVMAFLLGLFATNNVVYIFSVNESPILVVYLYAVLILIYFILSNPFRLIIALKHMTIELKLFFCCITFSILPVLFLHHEDIGRWLPGYILLILNIVYMLDVIMLYGDYKYIAKGIEAGIVVNFMLVVYEYVSYSMGSIFNLANLFPMEDIVTLVQWNAFRGQGLFKEPGHLMRFIAISFILILPYLMKQKKITRCLFVVMFILFLSFTRSASTVYALVGVGIVFVACNRKKIGKLGIGIVILLAIIAVVSIFSSYFPGLSEWLESFSYAITDLFNTAKLGTDDARIVGMTNAISLMKEFPVIGAGWNTVTALFMERGFYTETVKGTYSYLLSLIVELGIGVIPLLCFFFSKIRLMIRDDENIGHICLAAAMIVYFLLMCTTDYTFDPCIMLMTGTVVADYRDWIEVND